MLKTLLKKVSVLFILAATCCFFSCDLGAKDDSSNSDDDNEPITEITLKKLVAGAGPEDYYYNYTGKGKNLITDFTAIEPGSNFIVELSGKASKTFEVPLVLRFREVLGTETRRWMMVGRITKCNAGENFTVTYIFDIPNGSQVLEPIDISTVYIDLLYDNPFFDDELTISDLSFKQIKEENLDEKLITYTYHVGSNVYTEPTVTNADYYLPITSGHEDFFLSYWYGDNWNYKLTGWYDNPEFTGDPVTEITADDNTKDRDYYAKYDLIIRRGEWEDNGETKHNYNASVSFKDLGITKVPAPGSVLTLKLKGRASCDLDGTFDSDVIDVSNNGWNWLCRAVNPVHVAKDTEFTKYFAIKMPDNIPQVSLDDYKLNLVFNFKDISKEQEFYISDYEFTVAPETELVKYTYHSIGKERVLYGVKGEEYLLPEEEQNKEYFNWDLNNWAFDSVYWYENPECSGERVSKIAAEDNTKDRDFYASQRLIIRRNEWEDNGIKKHDYGRNPYLYETGITNISVPFSTLGLQISGKPSCDFNGRVEARIIDTSKGEWKWLNNVPFTLNVKKGELFAKNVVFNVQENECPSSLNNLVFEINFYFDDESKEQEFAINDFKLVKLPESEFVTYTYHVGSETYNKKVHKGDDIDLITKNTWWNDFNGFYNDMEFFGWYDNSELTGSPITSISAAENTTDRDFYADCRLKINRNNWGPTSNDYGYSGGPSLNGVIKDIGIPKDGSKLILEISGIPSATVDLPMQFKLWDWSRNENQMVCISTQTVHLEKNKPCKFAYILEIPSDANLTENSNLWLDFVYFKNYLDEELTISDIAFKQLDEKDLISYSYYIGANEQKKYVVKGSDFILPTEAVWRDYFKRVFTTQRFLGWYENPDFTGDSITVISAEDNTADKKFYGKWALKLDYTYWEGDEFYSNMTRFQEILPEITTVPIAGETYKLHFTGTVPKEGDFSFSLTNIVINGDNEKWEHFNNGWFSQHVAQGAYDFTIDVLIPEGAKFDSLYSTGLKISFDTSDEQYEDSLIINDFKVEVVK